jgi:WD repeat-containing protein 19
MKQYADAAALYKRAELWDKAVTILLTTKNFAAAGPLMERVTSPKLLTAYAKAKEAAKEYLEAARAYERARDMDAVVRLLLDQLGAPERAGAIVRQTRSTEGATLIAKFCRAAGDMRGAIEFLLLAKKRDEAFELAATHNEMGLYAQALRAALAGTPHDAATAEGSAASAAAAAAAGAPLPAEESTRIAAYYEARGEPAAAAKAYADAGAFAKALKLYLACGDSKIERAIEVVGRARSEAVTHTLIDHLMGESDGVPKDPQYIFKLYIALGNYPQAAKTALIIARQEQELGNYKVAHATLYETYRDLDSRSIRIPQELLRQLTLVHSYLLVKKLVKLEDHESAARMMVRVAKAVSKFPAHIVPILTSTVIECQRAGMKQSAYEYACVMMRPEYRDAIEEKFKRKIEALVRRPSTDEVAEAVTPCPFCAHPLPASELSCDACKNTLPFCVVTGRHMTLEDCSSCPSCRLPALYPALAAYLAVDSTCPMCAATVLPASISLVREPLAYLKKVAGVGGEADEDVGGAEGAVAAASAVSASARGR